MLAKITKTKFWPHGLGPYQWGERYTITSMFTE